MYSDPGYTLILIDAFLQRGHTDAEFATLHHFGSKARIASHRRYVSQVGQLQDNNVEVARKLESFLLNETSQAVKLSPPAIQP
jgi:hypothetical protein